jgi:hypothetical protein
MVVTPTTIDHLGDAGLGDGRPAEHEELLAHRPAAVDGEGAARARRSTHGDEYVRATDPTVNRSHGSR